jgi:hypothetical protein
MPRNSNRRGRSNNPTGRNQYSDWGVMELARDNPIAATAVAAGAAAAGLFLWSKRNQISEQLNSLSDQIGQWSEGFRSSDFEAGDDTGGLTTTKASSRSTRRGMSETGGGNASLGRRSGGGGTSASSSGRRRVKAAPTNPQ